MQVRVVDERDVKVEIDIPVFRVHDILEEHSEDYGGGPAWVCVYEVVDASASEVLAWTASDRTPAPVRSEVRCLVRNGSDVITVLLETVVASTAP